MPTIGQLEYCLADCNADFVLDDFNRDDFVPLVLIREGDALDIALRFCGHAPFLCYLCLPRHTTGQLKRRRSLITKVNEINSEAGDNSEKHRRARVALHGVAAISMPTKRPGADLLVARRSSIRFALKPPSI